jgi:AraC family transcriptional regulator
MSDATASPRPISAGFRKVPSDMGHALVRRGEWSFCAMEHSRIGAVEFEAPGVPFHHLALPLQRVPLRLGLQVDGRVRHGRNSPDTLTSIEAGQGGYTAWDGLFDSACFYFSTESLSLALGAPVGDRDHVVRTRPEMHAPRLVRMLHALHGDATAGQPHGRLVGDSIFVALARELVPGSTTELRRSSHRADGRRVRRAIEYIHACLVDPLDITTIAAAADTSPFYLNRAFRAALGCSMWQYVLRERVRVSVIAMSDRRLNLMQVSMVAGFETYASFAAALKAVYGQTPAQLRLALRNV